ncbi:MAG: hypothetical protein ABJH72_03980 [Reichenbachiella sp.]
MYYRSFNSKEGPVFEDHVVEFIKNKAYAYIDVGGQRVWIQLPD